METKRFNSVAYGKKMNFDLLFFGSTITGVKDISLNDKNPQ